MTSTATGWLGEYFSDMSLTGPPSVCRDDANINFDWGLQVATRWPRTDDGGRLYIDGVLAIDRWVDQGYPPPPLSVTMKLSQGVHTFVVEYCERGGLAKAVLTSSVVLDNDVTLVPSIAGNEVLQREHLDCVQTCRHHVQGSHSSLMPTTSVLGMRLESGGISQLATATG